MGFLEIKWGAAKTDEPPVETASVAALNAPPLKLEEAFSVIKDSYADATNPTHTPTTKSAKLAWVGGAVRVYSLLANRPADEVMAEVQATVKPAPAVSITQPVAPAGAVDPFKLTRPEDRTNRPPRPPGAQRPLTPEELQQPPAGPDDEVTVTASPLRRSAD